MIKFANMTHAFTKLCLCNPNQLNYFSMILTLVLDQMIDTSVMKELILSCIMFKNGGIEKQHRAAMG